MLRDEFALAEQTLGEIRTDFGRSLWELEASLLLSQRSGGLEANRKHFKEILEGATPLIRTFAYCFSTRVDSQVSAANYQAFIRRYLAIPVATPESRLALSALRFRSCFHDIVELGDEPLASIPSYYDQAPIVDRFLMFSRVLIAAISRFPFLDDAFGSSFDGCLGLLAAIDHASLRQVEIVLGGSIGNLAQPLLDALHRYTIGQYQEASQISRFQLAVDPGQSIHYDILARANSHSGTPPGVLSVGDLPTRILSLIQGLSEAEGDTTDTAQALLTLSQQLDCLPIGLYLFGQYLANARMSSPSIHGDGLALLSVSSPSPRLALALRPPQALKFLADLRASAPGPNASLDLLEGAVQTLSDSRSFVVNPAIPPVRALKYEALVSERLGGYLEAAAAYEQLAQRADASWPSRIAAASGRYRCALQLDQFALCVDIVADLFAQRGTILPGANIGALCLRVEEACDPEPNCLSFAIARYIASQVPVPDPDLYPVFVAYQRVLDRYGVARPSLLSDRASRDDILRLVAFLRYVCVPRIMDGSVEFENSDDLGRERLMVCQVLRKLDADSDAAYSREAAGITRAAAIKRALREVDRSKVHVDTAGIRDSLGKDFQDLVQRFVELSSLDPSLTQAVAPDLDPTSTVVLVTSETQELFRELFDTLRARFISSNQFGLDSYLSVRVRHGTFAGQLRAIFEREKLVTRKEGTTGIYDANQAWADRAQQGQVPYGEKADSVFASFSEEVDSLLEEVKSIWLQVPGEANGGFGLLDYEFSDSNLLLLQVQQSGQNDYDSILAGIFDALWERTDEVLVATRRALTDTLQERLALALDRLLADLSLACPRLLPLGLRDAIAATRTALQREIAIIAGWFERGGTPSIPDFPPSLLADSCAETLRNAFGVIPGHSAISGHGTRQLSGSTFPHLFDVAMTLLDNSLRHGRATNPDPELTISSDEVAVVIRVSNALRDEIDCVEVNNVAVTLAGRAREGAADTLTRREGGSGYYKIGKIVTHDLKQSDWEIEARAEEGRFVVVLRLASGGLTSEDPDN